MQRLFGPRFRIVPNGAAYDSALPAAAATGPLFGPAAVAAANMRSAKAGIAGPSSKLSEHARSLDLRMGGHVPGWRELGLDPDKVYVHENNRWRLAVGQGEEHQAATDDKIMAKTVDTPRGGGPVFKGKTAPAQDAVPQKRWTWRGLTPHLVDGPVPSVHELLPGLRY